MLETPSAGGSLLAVPGASRPAPSQQQFQIRPSPAVTWDDRRVRPSINFRNAGARFAVVAGTWTFPPRTGPRRPLFLFPQLPDVGQRRVQASQKLLEGQRDVSSIGGWRLSWPRPAAVLRVAPVAGCSITNPKVLRNEYRR
jgi:hypothetical protein